jgi:hypothetical protein
VKAGSAWGRRLHSPYRMLAGENISLLSAFGPECGWDGPGLRQAAGGRVQEAVLLAECVPGRCRRGTVHRPGAPCRTPRLPRTGSWRRGFGIGEISARPHELFDETAAVHLPVALGGPCLPVGRDHRILAPGGPRISDPVPRAGSSPACPRASPGGCRSSTRHRPSAPCRTARCPRTGSCGHGVRYRWDRRSNPDVNCSGRGPRRA